MKYLRIILYVLLGVLAACLWLSARSRPAPAPTRHEVEPVAEFQSLDATAPTGIPATVFHSLEVTAPTGAPVAIVVESRSMEPPVAEPEPLRPVQPLEERGDAMLFEASALEGTPFDQAVVRPFE